MGRRGVAVLLGLVLAGCGGNGSSASPAVSATGRASASPAVTGSALRYVALGDSYTIGTSVGIDERWPNQLVAALGPEPPSLELVANLAVNGFTSADVIAAELPALDGLDPGFVTLLIGVNDVVQGVSETTYRRNVERILDDLIARVGADRILVVTTPDYTVTPAGANYGDPTANAAGIRAVNVAISGVARVRTVALVDIYDLSLRAATDPSLVARDGLHPSGTQYALWVDEIGPYVEDLIAP